MTETTVTQRETKRADQLESGDWVRLDDDITEAMYAFRLSHVETYTDDRLGDRILAVAHRVGRWNPEVKRLGADWDVGMLTDDEIADAMDTERRELIAARLDQLGQLVRHKDLPLPKLWTAITVNFDFCDDVAAVAEFAKAVGVEVAEYGPDYWQTIVLTALQSGSDDRSAGVDLVGRATRPKEAEPATADGAAVVSAVPTPDAGLDPSRVPAEDATVIQAVPPTTGVVADGGLVDGAVSDAASGPECGHAACQPGGDLYGIEHKPSEDR